MKIYIAAHDQELARDTAWRLIEQGHHVTSTWLNEDLLPTHIHSAEERANIAIRDFNDVKECDTLLLLASTMRVPGGKHVEAGIAMGMGKDVHIIGHRENMLLWHPDITTWDSIEDFIQNKP